MFYTDPSTKAPVIDPGDEVSFLVERSGEERTDTVHFTPCLIYWRYDSRRTNSILRGTTEPDA
jgi:hypothetical protein